MPSPTCPVHGLPWKVVPAGVSRKTGKAYTAFQCCPVENCPERPQADPPALPALVPAAQLPPPAPRPAMPTARDPRINLDAAIFAMTAARDLFPGQSPSGEVLACAVRIFNTLLLPAMEGRAVVFSTQDSDIPF